MEKNKQIFKIENDEMSYDVNELTLKELQDIEYAICMTSMNIVVDFFDGVPFLAEAKNQIDDVDELGMGFLEDTQTLVEKYLHTKKVFSFIYAPIYAQSVFSDDEVKKIGFLKGLEGLSQYDIPSAMTTFNNIYEKMDIYVEQLLTAGAMTDVDCSKKSFLKKVHNCHKKMDVIMSKIIEIIDEANHPMIGNSCTFQSLLNLMKMATKNMDPKLLKEDTNTHVDNSEHITIQDSPEEAQRKNLIDFVNKSYARLCDDCLVDLKKQYSFSVKDLMKKIEKKVSNFEKDFEMPLALSTSTKKAENASRQLESILADIEEISSNSYSTSVWGN